MTVERVSPVAAIASVAVNASASHAWASTAAAFTRFCENTAFSSASGKTLDTSTLRAPV